MAEPLTKKRSPFWPVFLSAFIAPGAGQLVNKEYAKGFFLLFASLGSFLWFSFVVSLRLAALLPGNPEQWKANPMALKDAITQVVNSNPGMFQTFQTLILVVWIYGVVDAYLTARRGPPASPTPHETPDPNAQ